MSGMQVGNKVEELLDQDEQKELADKYGIQLLDKIDEGSFGIVFKGIDLSDGSLIAVKVTQQNREKYSSIETSILSGLDHPNIVKFKKFIEAHSNKYIVMEYIGCGNLYQLIEERRLAKKPFTEQEISEIMLYLLLAVKCMHENNVIHRDIKPENILLGSKEDFSQLKVSDFGLSVKYQDGAPFRSYSQRCGTVMFMAPEILLEKQYSKPIDIWSCGIILFMLFTMGRHPFKNSAETREEYIKRLSSLNTSTKTPTIELAFSKTQLASDLFLRMVAKEPLNRYTVSQVLKHPFITRKLDANIPLSFQENTRVFINQRKLAETMKALMMLTFIREKVSRSHESNYKLTKIVRPPSLSARIFQFTENNTNEELTSHREASSAVGSPRITDRTQLRSQKRLFREESPDTIKETDCIDERATQGQQQSQISSQTPFSSKNKLSVIDLGNNNNNTNNSPSAVRIMSSRIPPTPNQDHKQNPKYTNSPSISQHNGTTTTNSAQSSRRISKFQSLSPTGNTLLSLPSISKINTQQNQRPQQQQQQQQQFFPEPYSSQQQQFTQVSRNSPNPQQPSSNPPVKILSSHGSRAHRLSQQQQQQQQALATSTSTTSSSTQIKAASLQRPPNNIPNTVPSTPYQSSKTNNNGTKRATFQIKFLNSPLGSLSGTPTNSSSNNINNTGSSNQNSNNAAGQQQQQSQLVLDNMFKAIKTPAIIKGQQVQQQSQQSQQQSQSQLNSILNASKHCLTSNSNTNSPSNMNAGNTNLKLNGLLSLATQYNANHVLNHSTNDSATSSPIPISQNSNTTSTNSQKSLKSNITPNSPNHTSNKSIDNLTNAIIGTGKMTSQEEQGSSLIAKSYSQQNLQDLRGTKSKEAFKRSHFSNVNFKEFQGQYSNQQIPTQGSATTSNSISIQQELDVMSFF